MLNVNINDVMENENKQTELMTTFKMINENGSGSYSDFFDEFYPNVKRYGVIYLTEQVMEICGFAKQSSLSGYYNEGSEHYEILCELGMTLVKPKTFANICGKFTKTGTAVFVGSQEVLGSSPMLKSSTRQNATFEWYGDEITISNRGMYIFTMESVIKLGMLSGTEKGKLFTKNFIEYTKRCEAGMKAGQDFASASTDMVNNLEEKGICIYSLLDPDVFERYITSKAKIRALQYTNEYYKEARKELREVCEKLEKKRKEITEQMDQATTDFKYNQLEMERTTIRNNIKTINLLETKLADEHQKLTSTCKENQSNQTLQMKDIVDEYLTINPNTTNFNTVVQAYKTLKDEGIFNYVAKNWIPNTNFSWMYGTVGTFQEANKAGKQTAKYGQFGKDYLIYVMTNIDNNKPYETDLNKVEAILYGGKE